jgi:hypothetical protein
MSIKPFALLVSALLLSGGCAQNSSNDYQAPEKGDARFVKGKNTRADELYLSSNPPPGSRDYRDVYIAPVNFSILQIIPPADEDPDEGWEVTEEERATAQGIIHEEFASALGFHSAFNIVDSAEEAQLILSTRLVAIHPNSTRAEVEAGAKPGGSITASMALRDAKSGEVVVRSVDTKSTDDIWAFNQIDNEEKAISLIFRSWGNSMRRGVLVLQGRSSDPLAPTIITKEQ